MCVCKPLLLTYFVQSYRTGTQFGITFVFRIALLHSSSGYRAEQWEVAAAGEFKRICISNQKK